MPTHKDFKEAMKALAESRRETRSLPYYVPDENDDWDEYDDDRCECCGRPF